MQPDEVYKNQAKKGEFYDLAMAINMESEHLKNGDELPEDRMWKIQENHLVEFGSYARKKDWLTMRQYVNYLRWYYTTD